MRGYRILLWCLCSLLIGCAKPTPTVAAVEVVDLAPHASFGQSYTVKPGDSLYYIAWHYGLDYKTLAKMNHINPPYTLSVGQKLRLVVDDHAKQAVKVAAVTPPTTKNTPVKAKTNVASNLHWQWPIPPAEIKHNVKIGYLHRGIDIAASKGQVVQAAESGVVAYTGKGIQDFGTLVIINHGQDYLTAYAYNDTVYVKEGQTVKKGQKIASVGVPPVGVTRLHFEMRKHGKPINPLPYLPKA
jgi:lipoprotein NlpD